MSNATKALLTAIGYFVPFTWNWYHGQCMTERPIVLATVVGALLGDIKAGVVMGGKLETIYMGVVNIGGAMAAETVSASTLATAFVVGWGMDMDTAMATVAIPVGLAFNTIRGPIMTCLYFLAPLWDKFCADGNIPGIYFFQVFSGLCRFLLNTVIIYFCTLLGAEPLTKFLAGIPAWLMAGLNAGSGLLGAVGMAYLIRMLWSPELASYYFLGFTAFQYLGLPLTAIAVFAVLIVLPIAMRDLELIKLKKDVQSGGEEDFF
jgi:PTS system mannose-specific IIC component